MKMKTHFIWFYFEDESPLSIKEFIRRLRKWMKKIDWGWLIFRLGLGVILIADITLAVIVCYGIYIGAL